MTGTRCISAAAPACRATFIALAVFALPAGVMAAARLEILAPEGIVGDGNSSIVIEIKLPTAEHSDEPQVERLSATGGRFGTPRPADGGFVVSYVPPAIAADTTVTLRVVVAVGGKRFDTSRQLQVRRPTDPALPFASNGPLDLKIDSLPLVLRPGAKTRIHVRAPADGSLPRVFVSLGAVSAWQVTDDGRLSATYTPPKQAFPQAAIIAVIAQARIETLDWAVLPLFGKGFVRTTTEANAHVVIRVGAATYGPFRTDKRGKVGVPILAAPGVSKGTTTATDDLGNTKKVQVDLTAPPFNRLLTACADDSNRLLIFAIEPSGAPAQQAKIETRASGGSLSAVQRMAPGIFEALYEPPAAAQPEDRFEMTALLTDDPGSTSTCGVVVRSGGSGMLYVVSREPGIGVAVHDANATTPFDAPLPVAAGDHRLALSAQGATALDAPVEVQLGRRTDVAVGLEDGTLRLLEVRIVNPDTPLLVLADESPEGVEAVPPLATVARPAATGITDLGWRWLAALGAAGAGAVGIGVAGYYADQVDAQNNRARAIEAELADPAVTRARVDALAVEAARVNSAGRSAQSRQWAAMGTGIALVGAGVGLAVWQLVLGDAPPPNEGATLALVPVDDGARALLELRW